MAYSTFANAPVDAAVVEVGMGGSWDATNVADATVAVMLPIDVDHSAYLGSRPVDIAREKAGIIKPGSTVVSAAQPDDVAAVIAERAAEVGATVLWEGRDFGVACRVPAVGGQMMRLQGLRAEYDEVFLPLYGAHQAQNAARRAGRRRGVRREESRWPRTWSSRRSSRSPRRVGSRSSGAARRSCSTQPTTRTAPRRSSRRSRTPSCSARSIGVVGVMTDKDYEGVLGACSSRRWPRSSARRTRTPRALPAEELAEVARGIFGIDRVYVAPRLDDAIEQAATLAEEGGVFGEAIGSGAVLVTGSVITVGEARSMLKPRERR